MHHCFQVAFLMGFWQHFCDHAVAMCVASLESRFCACFVCFIAVIWVYGTLSFGDFSGGKMVPWQNYARQNCPWANPPPPHTHTSLDGKMDPLLVALRPATDTAWWGGGACPPRTRSALLGFKIASAVLMPVAPPAEQAPGGCYRRQCVRPSFPTERGRNRVLREGDELTQTSLRDI